MPEVPGGRTWLRLLEDQVLRETGNQYERLLLLSVDGRLLWQKNGTGAGIDLTNEEVQFWRGRVDLVTHNHPLGLSFTGDDVLTAIALDVRELNAFSTTLRYRLIRRTSGAWPSAHLVRAAVLAIDRAVQAVLAPQVEAGALSPTLALALHRHRRWQLFARDFAASVDYGVEQR